MATSIIPAETTRARRGRGDRQLFSSSDDNVMLKQILATHAPDELEFDVKPVLVIVEDIMHRSTPAIPGIVHGAQTHFVALNDKVIQSNTSEILELLAYPVRKVSSELSCKSSDGGDAHSTTMAILGVLSGYAWDAKAVISFAAFSVNHGEFWLVAQLFQTNPLARAIAQLKELPEILSRSDALKTRFDAITNLIKAMLDVTKCIVEFNGLPPHYIGPETPEMAAATSLIPTSVYWVIRGIVACTTQLMNLIGMGFEYISSTTEAWELSSLAHKLSSIYDHLRRQLALCNQHVDRQRQHETLNTIRHLFEASHLDNMKIIKILLNPKDEPQPLFDGYERRRVGLEMLRKRNVLLLISDLDISNEELSILHQMYTEARQQPTRPESQYEVVWLPIVDRLRWNETRQLQFEEKQNVMPWYSVHHPSLVDPAVNDFVITDWGFKKKPMLVVLDPQGKVANLNAFHMMWIWGSLAFPFTQFREEALWKEETWNMELLADTVDQTIVSWITQGKYICLYGGEDIEWIRRFTRTAKDVARLAGIQLEIIYMGKSNPKEKISRNNNIIVAENLSHVISDLNLIWFFWVRLESMWYSKVQRGMSEENDLIMPEIKTMLSFDGSGQGWAVISRGSAELTRAKSEIMLQGLNQFEQWRDNIPTLGFVPALDAHLRGLHTPHHCNRLILPGVTGDIPERVVCVDCGRPMEKFFMYSCCIE